MGQTGGGRGEEDIGNYSNDVAFFSGELSKKRKLEEQLNLPLAKHKFRLNPGNSEGKSLLPGCCTDKDRDVQRSFYCVKQYGQQGGMADRAVINVSNVLTFNSVKLDTHVNGQSYETSSACPTANSCISEFSKHIHCETSCSPNQACVLPGNQSCRPPGSHSYSLAGHSTTFDVGRDHSQCSPHFSDCQTNEKITSDDSDRLCGSLEFIFEKENLFSHRSRLKNNQFNRFSSRKSAVQANDCHAAGLLEKDATGTDSGESTVSAYKTSIVKRHKPIKALQFGSGSTCDEHGGCSSEHAQLVVLGDTHSSIETCTGRNASVCNPENTIAQYGSTKAVVTYTDIYEELDANREAYLEGSTLDTDIMPDTGETLPLFVLSSGRVTQNQDAHTGSKPKTIDKDFEQYFSMLML